jgi:nitrate reductase NapAB chaperone NapD
MSEEFYEELLTNLLDCGYLDLKELENECKLLEIFDGNLQDVIEETLSEHEKIDINLLLLMVFREVTYLVAQEVEDPKIKEKLEQWDDFFLNYTDSWYNINALDYPNKTKDEIVREVIKEFKKRD